MKKLFLIPTIFLFMSLGGCEFISTGASMFSPQAGRFVLEAEDKVMEETAEIIETYCDAVGDKIEHRKRFVDGVNERMDLRADGTKPYMIAQDCDGDGQPDF